MKLTLAILVVCFGMFWQATSLQQSHQGEWIRGIRWIPRVGDTGYGTGSAPKLGQGHRDLWEAGDIGMYWQNGKQQTILIYVDIFYQCIIMHLFESFVSVDQV